MTIDKALLDQLMKDRSPGDLFGKDGILSELTKALAERALTTELDEHLGEERAAAPDEGANRPANQRNGASQKTVTTDKAFCAKPKSMRFPLADFRDSSLSGGLDHGFVAVTGHTPPFRAVDRRWFERSRCGQAIAHLSRKRGPPCVEAAPRRKP